MLLVIFLTGAILWNLPWSNYDNFMFVSAVEPGYLDFDNLPETNFSCEGKVIGGYYADIETGCQMFHVCTIGQKSEITDIKFLCLNGTVFDQETRVCERLDEVDCSRSESFFDLNLELYGNNGGGYGIQPEDDGKEFNEQTCDEEYDEEGENTCKRDEQKSDVIEQKDAEQSDWKKPTTNSVSKIPSTSSTTTMKSSIPTSTRPSSTPLPKFHYHSEVSIPSTTQDPGLQLLALHESFQQNLKQHDSQSKLHQFNSSPKNNSSIFSYSKTPVPYSTYQLSSNTPQIKPSPFSAPLPSKLPNSLLNLSQNKNTFSNMLVNSNRTPSSFTVTFKPETPNFYNNKQHSQKVTNKITLTSTPNVPKQHQRVEPPVIYAYKILNTNSVGRPDRFGSTNFRYSLQTSPVTAPGEAFKMETINSGHLTHPSFNIAQNRPHSFHPKTSHFYSAKDELDEYIEDEDEELSERKSQSQPKSHEYNLHSNFARAIADQPKNVSNPAAAVSVVLSTSSVSSSISSKLQSAILNNTNNDNKNPLLSSSNADKNSLTTKSKNINLFPSALTVNQPNITEINDSLTEESPYYDEGNIEYDDNSPEYKDLIYPSDVQKIKQR
ncbi:hypothetical protein PGB90_002055 [Kerria lacca]